MSMCVCEQHRFRAFCLFELSSDGACVSGGFCRGLTCRWLDTVPLLYLATGLLIRCLTRWLSLGASLGGLTRCLTRWASLGASLGAATRCCHYVPEQVLQENGENERHRSQRSTCT